MQNNSNNSNNFDKQLDFTNSLVKSIQYTFHDQWEAINHNHNFNNGPWFDYCLALQFNLTVDKLRSSMFFANNVEALANAYLVLNTAKLDNKTVDFESKVAYKTTEAFTEALVDSLMVVANVERYTNQLVALMKESNFARFNSSQLDDMLEAWHQASENNIVEFKKAVKCIQIKDYASKYMDYSTEVRKEKVLVVNAMLIRLASIIRLSAVMMKDFQDAWQAFVTEVQSLPQVSDARTDSYLMHYLAGYVGVSSDFDINDDDRLSDEDLAKEFNDEL